MIRIIAAIDQKRGIAKRGDQPWLIPDDTHYFKEQTTSHGGVVLMGQKTFEVIGALPGRQNYVLSRETRTGDGVVHILDLDQFLNEQKGDVWIIGGASVYEQTMPMADELYLTYIYAEFGCDQFFPEYEHSFELVSAGHLHTQNGFIYTHNKYQKL